MTLSPITLICWPAAIFLALSAPSHNGVWLAALIFWGIGCAPIILRWTRTGGAVQVDPTT